MKSFMEMMEKILAIEDDRRLSGLIQDYLRENGFQVAVEDRGDRAADRIKQENPDLLVLDLMLPGKDGLTICQEIRNRYTGPILILTARADFPPGTPGSSG